MFLAITEAEGVVGVPWGRFGLPSILILTVPRRYFCYGSLLLLVLVVRIYTCFSYYVSDVFWWVLGSWMTTCLGKSCSFGLPRVPFVNCCQCMYLVVSFLVLRVGCGIWLYQFLIIAYLFTSMHNAVWYCANKLWYAFIFIEIRECVYFLMLSKQENSLKCILWKKSSK